MTFHICQSVYSLREEKAKDYIIEEHPKRH